MHEAHQEHGEYAHSVRQLQTAAPFPRLRSAGSSVVGLDADDLDPRRWGTTAISSCSVCDRAVELGGLHPVWISLRVATDVLPLLVNACSAQCVAALPLPPEGYVQSAHAGGRVGQPSADWD
ncbi:hypothetical protein HEP87_62805 [Streptomyces sp. S1D4-11]